MNEIIEALKLAKDSTYADAITESAKEYLRNELDKAIIKVNEKAKLYKNNITTNELLSLMKITESLMENEMNGTELQTLNTRIYKIKQMMNKQYDEIISEINVK